MFLYRDKKKLASIFLILLSLFHPVLADNSFFKEFSDDFLAFRYNEPTNEIGIRVGNPVLAHALEKIPNHYIRDTNYNRQVLKWFKFEGIDVGAKKIRFKCRLRIQKFEKKPWPMDGYFSTYDNAWDVWAGLHLSVEGRKVRGNVSVDRTESDWPSGIGGILLSTVDAIVGVGSWMTSFGEDFHTFSDFIGEIGAVVFNISGMGNITGYLDEVNKLNNEHLIFVNRIEYDPKGVWYWFAAEPSAGQQVKTRILNYARSKGWI